MSDTPAPYHTPTPGLLSVEQVKRIQARNTRALGPIYEDLALDADHDVAALLAHLAAREKQYADTLRGLLWQPTTGYADPDDTALLAREASAYNAPILAAATRLGIDLNETPPQV